MAVLSKIQWLGVALTFLAFGLLVPGVTQPLMTLSASVSFLGFEQNIFTETRSILATVEHLSAAGYPVIGGLVLTFSVIIPVIKAVLVLMALAVRRPWLWNLIGVLGKWSMADVFVVALMVAFFSAQAAVELTAQLHGGFYWFLGYCLLSVLAGQLMLRGVPLPLAASKTLHHVVEKDVS